MWSMYIQNYDKKYFIVTNIKTRLKQFSLVNEILRFKQGCRYYEEYFNHYLCWYGIMSFEEFKKKYTGKENINSFLVEKLIDELDKFLPQKNCNY